MSTEIRSTVTAIGEGEKRKWVLAFDIECAGGRAQDEVIAIGASVVNEDGVELDSLCLKGYFPGLTKFEQRTWDQFWSKNEDVLNTLVAHAPDKKGSDETAEAHKEWPKWAILEFHKFREKWELSAKREGAKLETVSDNKIFDGGFINDMYAKYLVGDGAFVMPLPYSASDQPPQYKALRETHSEQRGLLIAVDPTYLSKKGVSLSAHVEELYDCSALKSEHEHDHNPAHDAYSIAREAQILNGIEAGRIKLRAEKNGKRKSSDEENE